MANNYCQGSSKLWLPPTHIEHATRIVERVKAELNANAEGYCGVSADMEPDGVWFHDEENFTPEHVALIAQALLDELLIDTPFTFGWAYTCSKPRLDEFGGGACAVKRGEDPFWVDALSLAEEHFPKPT